MNCPNCGAEQYATKECINCGIFFEKWKPRGVRRRPGRSLEAEQRSAAPLSEGDQFIEDLLGEPSQGRTERQDLTMLGTALVAAILAYVFPLTRFVLGALVTLLHEIGHAVAGWSMGYPSIPAFDFVYGGGMTSYASHQPFLVVLIAGGLCWLGWVLRGHQKLLIAVTVVGASWLIFVSAEWRRELLMAAAGHLAELVLAALFLYMSLSGRWLKIPELERWPAAFCGFFVTLHSIFFAHRLRTDGDFLAWYRGGKGGMLMNDFEHVALDLKIHLGWDTSIEGVAGWLIGFSILPMTLVGLWYLYRKQAPAVLGE